MTATANGTVTDTYTLLRTAAGDERVSVSAIMHDIEVANHTSGSTPPAATVRGHPVKNGETEIITIGSGDHLWWRIKPTVQVGSSDDTPKGVYTVETV